jgi:anti-anti-sigma factor
MMQERREGVLFVRFSGQTVLDEGETLELQQALQGLPPDAQPLKLVVNLAGVQLIRTAAWGKLMILHQQVTKSAGQLKLCHLEPPVQECLEVMKLYRLLDVVATEDEAKRSLKG